MTPEPRSFRSRVPFAARLRDEDRDPACGPRLVVLVRRIRRDGQLPQPCSLGLIVDLADPHRLYRGVVADLNGGGGAPVVYPDRGCRGSPPRADKEVGCAGLVAPQRGL